MAGFASSAGMEMQPMVEAKTDQRARAGAAQRLEHEAETHGHAKAGKPNEVDSTEHIAGLAVIDRGAERSNARLPKEVSRLRPIMS